MRAVIDTNILVSAFLRAEGNPASVLNLVLNRFITTCYDSRIVAEYREVLSRPKFNMDMEKVETVLEDILSAGISVVPPPSEAKFVDESDRKFYEVAKYAGAVLITGNKRHYPDEPGILSAREFIERFI